MKNISIIIGFLFVFFTYVKAQKKDSFVLNGRFRGLPDGTKVYLRTQEKDTIAKALSKGDEFIFTGKLPLNGRFHFIVIDTLISPIGSKAIFLENKLMTVIGAVGKADVEVTGSKAHQEYTDLLAKLNQFEPRMAEISAVLTILMKNYNNAKIANDSVLVESLNDQRKEIRKRREDISIEKKQIGLQWIRTHCNSLLAPYIIAAHVNVIELEEVKMAFNQLSLPAKESYYGGALRSLINNIKLSAKIQEGSVIPDFKISTPDSIVIGIHEIAAKSKYTLIDCWASWCKPCRAEVPELKKIYAEYKDKGLNIVGISSDKNIGSWKKAITEDRTPWIHGLESKEMSIGKLFDLKAIPAYILIDSKGKLIAFDCAMSSIPNFGGSLRGEGLEKKLLELFDKN